jgi:golgi phosphoprotein 3
MLLNLTESFLLIAQHPSKSRLYINGVPLQHGIIGSLLLELSLEERLEIKDGKLMPGERKNQPDTLLAEIEDMIRSSTKPKKVKHWLTRLAGKSNRYKWFIFEKMEKKRLVRIEKRKFLGLIPYRITSLTGRKQRTSLIRDFKQALYKKENLNEKAMMLLGLVHACSLHKAFTDDRKERRKLKKDLKKFMDENPLTDAIGKTIKEVQAAVMVSIMAATAASTTATSGH